MEVQSLYTHDCITRLYSLLNQFNHANGDYQKCLKAFSLQLNSLKGFVLKNENNESSMDDICICLNFWLDQLFLQEDNDIKLVLLLEAISQIITLQHILFTKFEVKSNIKADFIKCLHKFMDMIDMTLDSSKSVDIKEFLKTDLIGKQLAYINYYDKNIILDENNNLSTDLLLNNYLLRSAFLKEYNTVIKLRVNINDYTFNYLKYTSNEDEKYNTALNVDKEEKSQQYIIHKIVNNKLLPIPNYKYSKILVKIADENCFLQFLYHTIDIGGFDAFVKNNEIFKYYMNVIVLSNFDTVYVHNLFKENNINKPTIFMDMLKKQIKPQREVYEKQVESVDNTFFKQFLDMQITLLVTKQGILTSEKLYEQAKILISYTFGMLEVFDFDLISRNNGKLPLLYLVEFCLLPYIRRLYYLNKEFMEFIDWEFFSKMFVALVETHNYSNIGFVITELFNYWIYIPTATQELYVNDIIIKYWDDIFFPESHGVLTNSILFCKFIVFKQIYVHYDKVLELLMKLQVKYEFYGDSELLILPHYRYLNLFKYPSLKKSKYYFELYDMDSTKYQLRKYQKKHILNLNKELPSIKPQKNNHNIITYKDKGSESTDTSAFDRLFEPSESSSSNYGISDFLPSFFSKKIFNKQEEPLYETITGDIEKETKDLYARIHFKSSPIFFYRFSYLDDLVLENVTKNQDNFMDLGNDITELVNKMGSFMGTSTVENEKALMSKLNYSMNNILKIKQQKENELQVFNDHWTDQEKSVLDSSKKPLKMKLPVEVEAEESDKSTPFSNVEMSIKIFNKTVDEYNEFILFKDYFEQDSIMIVHDYGR